jgi:NADH-quinone oxidoreductase subunit C
MESAEVTTPGPQLDPSDRPTTDSERGLTEASPADKVSYVDQPDEAQGRAAVAVLEEPTPVIEPATDMTGIRVIDPAWVYSGYWGPLDEAQHPAIVALRAAFPDAVREVVFFRDEVTIHVSVERWADIAIFLRDAPELSYRMLSDLTAVDMLRLRATPRFDVVATLYSIPNRQRLRIKASLDEGHPCPTLTGVHHTAGWLERECYDMFGIIFEGHPDLRRMLLAEDWDEGHPLRKDYPIRGYKQYVQPGFENPAPRITDYRRY